MAVLASMLLVASTATFGLTWPSSAGSSRIAGTSLPQGVRTPRSSAGAKLASWRLATSIRQRPGPPRRARARWQRDGGWTPVALVVPSGGVPFAAHVRETGRAHSERRRRIWEYIRSHPGSHYRELLHELDVPPGNLRYHLGWLQSHGMITEVASHGRRCFFDSRFPGPKDWYALPETDRRTVELVRANPGITESSLAQRLQLTQSATCKHLQSLRAERWVRALRVGLAVEWQALR